MVCSCVDIKNNQKLERRGGGLERGFVEFFFKALFVYRRLPCRKSRWFLRSGRCCFRPKAGSSPQWAQWSLPARKGPRGHSRCASVEKQAEEKGRKSFIRRKVSKEDKSKEALGSKLLADMPWWTYWTQYLEESTRQFHKHLYNYIYRQLSYENSIVTI